MGKPYIVLYIYIYSFKLTKMKKPVPLNLPHTPPPHHLRSKSPFLANMP